MLKASQLEGAMALVERHKELGRMLDEARSGRYVGFTRDDREECVDVTVKTYAGEVRLTVWGNTHKVAFDAILAVIEKERRRIADALYAMGIAPDPELCHHAVGAHPASEPCPKTATDAYAAELKADLRGGAHY